MSFELLERSAAPGAEPVAVGIVGTGMISHVYMRTFNASGVVRLKACSGRNAETNAAQAELYGCQALSFEDLLADPEIKAIVNLTPPAAHYEISRRILEAGKHLSSEKPLTLTLEESQALIDLAAARGLRIACAPDTFLGRSHQAARRAVDAGLVGRIVGGTVTVASHGMEHWHPAPGFFYQAGGGPVLDVGPYGLTQLVNLLGPVAAVTAIATTPSPTRRITAAGPLNGTDIPVEIPTTVTGGLLFENGANVAATWSWDIWKHRRPEFELYGAAGSLANPDPNVFTGTVMITDKGGDWTEAPGQTPNDALDLEFLPLGGPRGLGLIDMILAIAEDRPHRCAPALAHHVLEVLLAVGQSAAEGRTISIASRTERPAPL
jgi:predicted dehydrogenase